MISRSSVKNEPIHFVLRSGEWVVLLLVMILAAGCSSTQEIVDKGTEPTTRKPPEPQKEDTVTIKEQVRPARADSVLTFHFTQVPPTPREFRGAWIATVSNIDWPSKPGLPVIRQKEELRAMMDRAVQLNMNAIILQIRPAADALYHSPFEPWSEYLTGKQGKPPEPFYDPLKFAIEEAHRRGLELHAWFNPFRAYHPSAEGPLAPNHIVKRHPEMVVKYGDYYWLDPGMKMVQQYSINVITDVVRRYDIDGVHLDDYFYPYPSRNHSFADTDTYARQMRRGPSLGKADWRRQNVNQFIKRLSKEIKLIDPHVRFGISPFGIWRPGHPKQIRGFDAYDRIYADARKWLRKGWVDYLSPQLYWPIDQKAQSFSALLRWWCSQNPKDRHLWPGLYTSKLRTESTGWKTSEIERQIAIIRQQQGADGAIHFSMKALMQNKDGIVGELMEGKYAREALVPATYWLSDSRPATPEADIQKIDGRYAITLHHNSRDSEGPWLWIVKKKYGSEWRIDILPGWKQSVTLPVRSREGRFSGAAVSVVNEVGRESKPDLIRQVTIPSR